MAKKRRKKARRKNPSHKAAAPKRRRRKRRANPSTPRRRSSARRTHRRSNPTRRRRARRRHRNPGFGKEILGIAAGLGAGVIVTLASAVLAPTSTTAAWGITAAGVAAGLGLAMMVDPVIGGAVAVGSAAPMVVTKVATKLYQSFVKPAATTAATTTTAAAPATTKGINGANPFGMRAVAYGDRRQAAAALGLGDLGAIAYGVTRADAAANAGMGNPFGMGAPAHNPYGVF